MGDKNLRARVLILTRASSITRASALVVVALFGGAFAVRAQTVEPIGRGVKSIERRIKFPRKRKTVVIKGSVAAGRNEVHTFAASAKQKLMLKLVSKNKEVLFLLLTPGGEVLGVAVGAREWTGELPDKGDYTITVVNNARDSPASDYTLEVALVDPPRSKGGSRAGRSRKR